MSVTAPSPVLSSQDKELPPDPAPLRSPVADYYRQTIEDYQTWSRQGYMHFGLWRAGLNPFDRQSMLESMNDLVFDQLQIDNPDPLSIGDFGCGLAAVSRYGATRFPLHRWFAVTICPEQVIWGRGHLPRELRRRVKISRDDFHDLPMADNTLDAGFFLESFCHAQNARQVLQQSARVIRPGGRLVIVDGMMRQRPEQTSRLARRLSATVAENWAVPEFPALPEFEQAVESAGFEIQSRRELGWKIAPCVAHTPILVGWHTLKLMATGQWAAWKRRHMIGCTLGVLLGMLRRQFGYFAYTLRNAR